MPAKMQSKRLSKAPDRAFYWLCASAVAIPLVILLILVGQVVIDSLPRLDWSFLVGGPSRKAAIAGIYPALIGSLYLITLTSALALPIGVGAAVYLEEYGKNSRLATLLEVNIANLAGVPSVIYGLLGLGVFVRAFSLGHSLIAGAATMALLVLPIIIVATREALRTVPDSYREAGLALGASRLQTIRRIVLPAAIPGILTGSILAISRAIGETAPLIVVGAVAYITFVPDSLGSDFSALPIQIFNWVSRPQKAFLINAAAGIVVLLSVMLLLNTIAVLLRNRLQKRM